MRARDSLIGSVIGHELGGVNKKNNKNNKNNKTIKQ